mmetsp:Transcript_67079/g.212305  ORF Transcript_67079/g.212305 Transcript_67079/m.212305 type:complete len:402 (-) Transcript_67079:108-1313(-)
MPSSSPLAFLRSVTYSASGRSAGEGGRAARAGAARAGAARAAAASRRPRREVTGAEESTAPSETEARGGRACVLLAPLAAGGACAGTGAGAPWPPRTPPCRLAPARGAAEAAAREWVQVVFICKGGGVLRGLRRFMPCITRVSKVASPVESLRGQHPLRIAMMDPSSGDFNMFFTKKMIAEECRSIGGPGQLLVEITREDSVGECVSHVLGWYRRRLGASFVNTRQNGTGNTPLVIACYRGFPRSVALLLDAGADPVMQDSTGTAPVMWAVQGMVNNPRHEEATEEDFAECVRAFRDRGHDICHGFKMGTHLPTLPQACEYGFGKLVKMILKAGADVHERSMYPCNPREANSEGVPSLGATALHQACSNGDVQIIKTLLKAGASTRMLTPKAVVPVRAPAV